MLLIMYIFFKILPNPTNRGSLTTHLPVRLQGEAF
jgi:hypothetical protein